MDCFIWSFAQIVLKKGHFQIVAWQRTAVTLRLPNQDLIDFNGDPVE